MRRLEGLSEYHTPHTTDVVSDGSEVLHTIDMNAAIRHADEMSEEVASHEGCRCEEQGADRLGLLCSATSIDHVHVERNMGRDGCLHVCWAPWAAK